MRCIQLINRNSTQTVPEKQKERELRCNGDGKVVNKKLALSRELIITEYWPM